MLREVLPRLLLATVGDRGERRDSGSGKRALPGLWQMQRRSSRCWHKTGDLSRQWEEELETETGLRELRDLHSTQERRRQQRRGPEWDRGQCRRYRRDRDPPTTCRVLGACATILRQLPLSTKPKAGAGGRAGWQPTPGTSSSMDEEVRPCL